MSTSWTLPPPASHTHATSDVTSGTLDAARMPALTGAITTLAGSVATTLAAKAVTLAKMDDMATASLIYRKTAGTGPPEVQTLATLKTDLGLSGTNSGDQTLPTRASLGLDTTDSPHFTGLNLGHASDTTITRVSAGVIAVEGATVATLPLTARLTGDVGPTTSTTLANVTGAALSLAANTTYYVEMVVLYQASATTEGIGLGLTFPAVTYAAFEVIAPIAANGTGQGFHGQIVATGGSVLSTGVAVANTTYAATIRGVIRPSASGSLQLQYRTETGTSGANVTVKSGTIVRAEVVP